MRKTIYFFSFISFAMFSLLGYLTASDGFPHRKSQEVRMGGPTPFTVQHNLLLIQVDRLDTSRPVLKAAWIAGYFRSPNQTVLTYHPLVSENGSKVAETNLRSVFSMNRDGSPGGVFLQAVAANGIKTLGYLVIDEQGFGTLNKLLENKNLPVNLQTTSRTQRLLDTSCQYILAGHASESNAQKLVDQTLGGHLRTNLAIDDLTEAWNRLLEPKHTSRCEILP